MLVCYIVLSQKLFLGFLQLANARGENLFPCSPVGYMALGLTNESAFINRLVVSSIITNQLDPISRTYGEEVGSTFRFL